MFYESASWFIYYPFPCSGFSKRKQEKVASEAPPHKKDFYDKAWSVFTLVEDLCVYNETRVHVYENPG